VQLVLKCDHSYSNEDLWCHSRHTIAWWCNTITEAAGHPVEMFLCDDQNRIMGQSEHNAVELHI
jgi:hypothetical protein